MDNSDLPTSSNGKDECEEDTNTVTMVDVLKAEEILEENADAVLGPGDDKNCTYSEGYMKRQALYSCLTCLPADGHEQAGICLACSYHCHGDHDLVELYTKRNFRCDCGNSLFKNKKCVLDSVKSATNENNSYNQNFRGVYCSCTRPYPDPEDCEGDVMYQCIVCEDWFHSKHLDSTMPREDDFAEMICGTCTDKLPFLQYYLGYAVTRVSTDVDQNDSSVNISVTDAGTPQSSPLKQTPKRDSSSIGTPKKGGDHEKNMSVIQENGLKTEVMECTENAVMLNGATENDKTHFKQNVKTDSKENDSENKLDEELKNKSSKTDKTAENEKTEDVKTASPVKNSNPNEVNQKENECLLKSLKMLPRESGATFWPENFRKLLCPCASCLELYKSSGVPFITDEEDTVLAYEEKGKACKQQSKATQYERGMEALNSLDRVQQMEAVLGFNHLKSHLRDYLAKFVENKKVVREEDIREFFSGMQARKRQKMDIPYNCR